MFNTGQFNRLPFNRPPITIVEGSSVFSGEGFISSQSLVEVFGQGIFSSVGVISSESLLEILAQSQIYGEGTILSDSQLDILGAGIISGQGTMATYTSNNVYSGNTNNEVAVAASYGYID